MHRRYQSRFGTHDQLNGILGCVLFWGIFVLYSLAANDCCPIGDILKPSFGILAIVVDAVIIQVI